MSKDRVIATSRYHVVIGLLLYKFKDINFFKVIVPTATIWYKAGVKGLIGHINYDQADLNLVHCWAHHVTIIYFLANA
jgi:hypothetical protein